MTKEKRQKVYEKYNGHCAYCGKEIEYNEMHVDHFIPKYHTWSDSDIDRNNKIINRGTDNITNLMPSCRRCNYHKATLSINEFKQVIAHKIKVCNDNVAYKIAKDYGLVKETGIAIKFYFEQL
jgi:5-methylcytosine-specific restriction endonuclease McrA